ncbi:MAG: VOC family protein [Stellaceae bacterium]
MLDHVTLAVRDLSRSRSFYDRALAPLGIERLYSEGMTFLGYGVRPKAFFWIGLRAAEATGAHVAFAASSRAAVDAFHEAALAGGGHDNGAPGLRQHYHASYYSAFALDPDGHNIEAVCHDPRG